MTFTLVSYFTFTAARHSIVSATLNGFHVYSTLHPFLFCSNQLCSQNSLVVSVAGPYMCRPQGAHLDSNQYAP